MTREEKDLQGSLPPRPTTSDSTEWKAYWKAQGLHWPTEPEINVERQRYLTECRRIIPNLEEGIYPFKDIKLSRADVEWLLATHEDGRGPVDWHDESQWKREGPDLRGSDLQQVDLHDLPLTRLIGGLGASEWGESTEEQRSMAAMTMKGAYLKEAHLEGAKLIGVHLGGAKLWKAHLAGACLWEAHLEGAELWNAQMEGVGLIAAHLEGAELLEAHLEGALLRDVILSDKRHIGPAVADIQWGSTNLGVADWAQVIILGDEIDAHQETDFVGQKKDVIQRLKGYQSAVRANRQLAVALRNQGLNEEADRFAYRAQLLQRKVWRLQNRPLKFLLSWFLYLLAGYGYRPLRSLIAYLVIIFGFMGLYLLNAHFVAPHLTWDEALVLSVSSFHGRGFFTQNVTLGDTYARLAAGEAIVGLFIEISFIATFTQRFFGK